MKLYAVAAVLGRFSQAEAFLQFDGDYGALAGPVDARITA